MEAKLIRCVDDRDTITVPTDAMFDLMKEASRGDDVYGVRPSSATHLSHD